MKRAIVTGASRGIGRAVAEMLLDEGWRVIGLSRTDPDIDHSHFDWTAIDLGTETIEEVFGEPIDALVHCAGIRGPHGSLLDTDPEQWEQTVVVNLLGAHRVLRGVLPSLLASDDGRILLFSGGGAFSPEPGYSAYAASKGATVALMETLAAELDGTTVTVNAVAPGFVPTDIHTGTPHEHTPSTGEELGRAVACVRHLLSPATQGLTGRTISAAWDDWESLSPWTLPLLGNQGQRDRHKIAGLQNLLIHQQRAI